MTPVAKVRTRWVAVGIAAFVGMGTVAIEVRGVVGQRVEPARTVVASIRAEPRSFNRYVARDLTTTVLTYLTHSALVRVNRVTGGLEPELASTWDLLGDQRTYRLHLRPNVKFSDGVPFTADDVIFSFRAIYDPKTESPLADTLEFHGRPLSLEAEDATTIRVTFPERFGPGLRVLDGIPIFPRHRLEASLATGTFRQAWRTSTLPSAIAGLGPFRLESYAPGQRLVLSRNPYYWRNTPTERSPKLDRVVLEIVPDQNAELLRLSSGEIDLTQSEIRPADYSALTSSNHRHGVSLTELGIGQDGDLFWINLNPAGFDSNRQWLQTTAFRRAVSQSVDRDAFVSMAYLGAAVPGYTLVSPGNREWYVDERAPAYNPAAAASVLAELGLRDRDANGIRRDSSGHEARLTMLTQAGNTSLETGAALIRDSLAKVGVAVDVAPLEVGALTERILSGNYDAAYFRLLTTDTDPGLNSDFWMSSGSAHVWYAGQKQPSTEWERDVDNLFGAMSSTSDAPERHRLFGEIQQIVARELPALCFAFPRLSIATSDRLLNATPAPFRPPVLWNPAVLDVRRP